MNGKGSKPRNCFSKQFKDNYEEINWEKSGKTIDPKLFIEAQKILNEIKFSDEYIKNFVEINSTPVDTKLLSKWRGDTSQAKTKRRSKRG